MSQTRSIEEEDLADPDFAPPVAADDWNPELAETLLRLLEHWMRLGGREMDAEIRKLEEVYHDALYSELIYLLSHLRFPGSQAKSYWDEIVALREHMCVRLESFVDLRVALASYFMQVNRKLKNPKIIELQLFERTRAFAYRDELTGLHNYRFFHESLRREMARYDRSNQPVSLVMVDVDHFKDYNDRSGHEAGNRVLAMVARLLSRSLRSEDTTYRYGGEEFVLLLPESPKIAAQLVAERARAAVEGHVFPHADSQPLGRVTVSMGVATCPGDATQPSALIRCADRALYAAKAEGRNQVQLYARSLRSFHRVRARLEGRYRALSQEFRPMTTLDISEGGLLFLTEQSLPAGSLVELHLAIPGAGPEVTASGRVVHVLERNTGGFDTAVRIMNIDCEDRRRLTGYMGELRRLQIPEE